MLARIAHELYWIGRSLTRAEHTARMLDGVFHADLQGRPDDPAEVRLSWDSLLAIMGAEPGGEPATRDDVVTLLTLDPDYPASVLRCVTTAREGARTGPYSVYALVKERCGLFWGVTNRTMLRDEAHAFLRAGAAIESADMVLRMLRVALPADTGDEAEAHLRDGQALALLQAVGGFQAFRRSVPAPPNAAPVARFLLYEGAYPDSVSFSIAALHSALSNADDNARNASPVLRLGRLMADLDFRSRALDGASSFAETLGIVQRELAQVDLDIAQRYFAGAAPPVPRLATA